jgi:hypothetical protein
MKACLAKDRLSQAWCFMPIIPALRRWRQEDCEIKTSLGYRETLSQKQNKTKTRTKKIVLTLEHYIKVCC